MGFVGDGSGEVEEVGDGDVGLFEVVLERTAGLAHLLKDVSC